MAVADWSYRRWRGQPTSYLTRTAAITRYALADVFRKRLALIVYLLCLLPPLGLAVVVYVSANLKSLTALFPALEQSARVDIVTAGTYGGFVFAQSFAIMLWTLVAGPSLVSRDLANNALGLLLSKSLRVRDYVIGKWAVLLLLLSGISWVPLLLVFGLQYALAPPAWRAANSWIAGSILLVHGSLLLLLTAVVTAVSAHVRRKVFAQAAFVGVLVVSLAFAGVLAGSLRTRKALVVSPMAMVTALGDWAFAPPVGAPDAGLLPPVGPPPGQGAAPVGPVGAAASIFTWIGLSILVLWRRLRPVEVVR